MAGRAQQKKHKRSGLLADGDEMAAARQQQKEVWLLQSQLAEGLLAGLADEDVFAGRHVLAWRIAQQCSFILHWRRVEFYRYQND